MKPIKKSGWNVRRIVLASVLMAMVVALAGNALARYPRPGHEWGERNFYDSSGQIIGGMRIECDGYVATWGNTSGSPGPMNIYPCYSNPLEPR